ncbi:hypothetical protein D9M71_453660 [compost metagenome]
MQARQQPFGAEGRQGRQTQAAFARLVSHGLQSSTADPPEGFAHLPLIQPTDISQAHLAAFAAEQGQAQLLLQRLHLAAHRALGQRQLGGGAGVAFMPGGGFESQQQ